MSQGIGTDVQGASVEELFLQSQENFDEALARSAEESKGFNKVKHYRMEKLGVYRLRIMPLCPDAPRKGFEQGVRAMLLNIAVPGNDKKKSAYVNVCHAKQAGFTADLIDTYQKEALGYCTEQGDEEMVKKLKEGSFGGGLKWDYNHAMYVIDLDNPKEGLQLWTCSHAQFKELEDRKLKLWEKKCKKDPNFPCPISSIASAYPVEVEKKKDNGKVTYVINIDNESDAMPLTTDELKGLLSASRVHELVYKYTRYHLEATIVFLKQYDERMGLSLMSDSEVIKEVIAGLESELPKDDVSHFSFDKKDKKESESDNTAADGPTLDSLFGRYEELKAQGLGDKTEEGQSLRTAIRGYVQLHNLTTRVLRTKTNIEILEAIELEVEENGGECAVPTGADADICPNSDGVESVSENAEEPAAGDKPARASRTRR